LNDQSQVAAAIARLKAPVFLVRSQGQGHGRVLSLYTTEASAPRDLARQAADQMQTAGIAAAVKTVRIKSRRLRQRSLEAMIETTGRGEIAYDPTGLVSRGAALLALADRLRRETSVKLNGLFLDPERRTVFVIVDRKAFPAGGEARLQKRLAAMGEVARVVHAWRVQEKPSLEVAVRIGFELPASVAAIAIDRKSVATPPGRWQRGIAAALGSLLGLGALASAQAADVVRPPPAPPPPVVVAPVKQPAVAAPNLDILFGDIFLNGDGFNNKNIGAVGVKGAIPIGQAFGAQVDAAIGTDNYWGIGGHFFWRDPSHGLFGLVASHESLDGSTVDRYGGEAELYLQNVTLRGDIGAEEGNAPHTVFGDLDLTFYVHANFELTGGANYENAEWRGHAGLEWQPQNLSGLSLFADGDFGGNNVIKAVAGVSFHFGTHGVSLIDRDRKYDPTFSLFHFAPQTVGYTPPPD
jgi:hypothetical protein